ncbi:MAG: bifunctional (p)ppGpp synthetase/guanosine-3',5'-bis(diphosphate) 3'-pyrophosphohydrolase [Erysipelotrichaceae bacterium]|nr:bifunctional (p)ppGpp synthetase/guanosine-3',5'-bis(diphosphate) 3'-pyrophosphohydrolase [Erysipelotrichaceae bacterium]
MSVATAKSMTRDDVMREAGKYITNPESVELIRHAADYAYKHHEGQFRKSGEPYTVHLDNVAYILAELRCGPKTIAAGFLHDTIEDTGITREELAAEFDDEIADLVEAVTKIGALKFRDKNDPEYQAANHRKIFIAMAKDVRVILIKLSDRLHNMRTLEFQPEASQKRISQETLDVYAPIAHRLGISQIKNELEDLCFMYLNPEEYHRIAHLVEAKKAERDNSVTQMITDITKLLKEHHLEFRIFGRSKHLYSIYHKMESKQKRFDEILDLLAIRIVTKTELNCYEILGYIHATYTPIQGRLKDYIAVPKQNMYQSIHTTIIGFEGKIFEVQIRTERMDEIAEMGVAAHWRYKEGSRYDAKTEQKEIEEKLSLFRDFAEFAGDNESASEYMDSLRRDVFETSVYVMTPMGRVIDLPNGATPIDFAYRVHTEVGHTAVGAIVNDAMVPLNTELHTGDVVQIKTMKGTGPSEDWLKIVKTNQARNKIRAYLQHKENEKKAEKIPAGEKILIDELKRRGFDPDEYVEKRRLEAALPEFKMKDINDLFYAIAVKSINPVKVVEKLTNEKRSVADEMLSRILAREAPKRKQTSHNGIIVPGIESMKMTLAQCCNPVYGDEIRGYITKNEGVKVHRADCRNIAGMTQRMISVEWDTEDTDRTYESNLTIVAHDRNFLLTDIVTCTSQFKTPMNQVSASVNRENLTSTIKMNVSVRNLDQLQNLIANLRKIESVISVERNSH